MKKRIFLILLSVIIIVVATIFRFVKYYGLSCETYINSGVKGIISNDINNLLCNALEKADVCYDNIARINKNMYGEIESIVIESATITMLANEFSGYIYENCCNDDYDFGVALGSALGSKIFSDKGPKIRLSVSPIGTVKYEINSEFKSEGINQTLHRIGIIFTTEIECIAPFNESVLIVKNEIILVETLIIGKVPNTLLPTW